MTSPPRGAGWPVMTGSAALLVRLVAVAAVIAMLIAGILCLDHLTADRVATGLISGGVLGACLVII